MPTGSLLPSSIETAIRSPSSDGSSTSGRSDQGIDELLDGLESWWRKMDASFVRAVNGRPEKISCYSCTHSVPGCCNQKVIVPFLEALPIARYLRNQGRDTPELREKLRVDGDEAEAADRETWFHEQRRPCAFLRDGRCTVYAVRPVPCRSYYVISPADDCQPGNYNGIRSINNGDYLAAAIGYARKAHYELGLKESDRRILWGTLPRMVLLALEVFESDDFIGLVRSQSWPNADNLDEWVAKGAKPFQNKLHQIRKSKEG